MVDKRVITFRTATHDILTRESLHHTVTSEKGHPRGPFTFGKLKETQEENHNSGSAMSSLKSGVNECKRFRDQIMVIGVKKN